MFDKIRHILGPRFTRWYMKRGYTFEYEFPPGSIHSDGTFSTPLCFPKPVWNCPWWVKPLLIFFSPSIYMMDKFDKIIVEGILQGLMLGEGEKDG